MICSMYFPETDQSVSGHSKQQIVYLMRVADEEEVHFDLPEKSHVHEVRKERHHKLVLVLPGCIVELDVEYRWKLPFGELHMVDVLEQDVGQQAAVLCNVVPVPIEGHVAIAGLDPRHVRFHEVLACNIRNRFSGTM